jgi:gas vesicle protein
MDFFPIPESAAKLAAADKMVGAMMDLVSAIDERIQEHIGAVAQYTSATVNGVSGAVNKQIKSQTAKVLKAADKIQSRVEDTANTAQAMLQEHTAAAGRTASESTPCRTSSASTREGAVESRAFRSILCPRTLPAAVGTTSQAPADSGSPTGLSPQTSTPHAGL